MKESECGYCRVQHIVRGLVHDCGVVYERANRAGWTVAQSEWKRTRAFNDAWPDAWKHIREAMRPRWQFWKRLAR